MPVQVTTVGAGRRLQRPDCLVAEEPLEISIGSPGQPSQRIGVTMRTPGNDFELAAGFLVTEGVLDGQNTILSVSYCSAPSQDEAERFNSVGVKVARPVDLDSYHRMFTISSACGVCGAATVEQIERRVAPFAPSEPWPLSLLLSLPESLRSKQVLFNETGGLHGAGLFDRSGGVVAVREDVGRHNAVDKLVGWAALNHHLPLDDAALAVSGRLGFEIVQKAAVAGITHLVAVSAPSSLAVDLARRLRMTVIGFAREDQGNVYCGDDAVDFSS